MPTDDASAAWPPTSGMSGPRSRGSSDTVSPTVITLPSSACRSVAGEIDCVARLDPRSVTDRAPYTVTGATITVVSSRSPALDSVTSSSSAVPAGVSGRRHARHRGGGARAGQRHRVPLPNAQGGNGFRMQPDHAAARVHRRGVQARGQGERWLAGRSVGLLESNRSCQEPGLRSPSRAIGPAVRLRPADRPPRRALLPGLSSQTSGCSASKRLVRIANGMWMT